MTYNVFGGTLSLPQSFNLSVCLSVCTCVIVSLIYRCECSGHYVYCVCTSVCLCVFM